MAKKEVPRGFIERCTVAQIEGWAIDGDQPADLDILVNGLHVARIQCACARQDISAVDAGFSFVFSQILLSSDSVSVRFRNGPELDGSPLHPNPYEGHFDRCTTELVEGWATCQRRPGEVDIFVDDVRLARVSCHVSRPDLASLGMPVTSGFSFRFSEPIECSARVFARFADGTELTGSPRTPILEEPTESRVASTSAPSKEGYDVDFAYTTLASEFVDDSLFFRGLGRNKQDRTAVELYLSLPWEARPDLSWFFDKRFYAQSYPDIMDTRLDPLIHFIAFGVAERRNPHPLIDLRYIHSSNPEMFSGTLGIDELLKFLTHDLGDPSLVFSIAYYKAQLDDEQPVSGGQLLHFLRHGILQGLKPAPGFAPVRQYDAMDKKSFDVRDSLQRLTVPVFLGNTGAERSAAAVHRSPITTGNEIHLYCLSLNEAKMLPFFLRHYGDVVDRFYIFDNGSTDATLSMLASEERVSVTHFVTEGDSFVRQERLMSDTIWQQSRGRAAWVVMVDMDEFLFHPNLPAYLDECARQRVTAIDSIAYEMISDNFPPPGSPLTETVTMGVREPFYDKLCIFNPNAIDRTNYRPGRHTAAPTGQVTWPTQKEVKLLHYKRLGVDYVVNRYAHLSQGLKPGDLSNGWGLQYLATRADVEREVRELRRKASPVPGLNGWIDLDLALNIDGRMVCPVEAHGNTYTFLSPEGGGQVFRLVSSEGGLETPDSVTGYPARRGIPVTQIFLRSATGVHIIAPDDPQLLAGWTNTEAIGSLRVRWTDGDAVIPIPRHAGPIAAIEVSLLWPMASCLPFERVQ